MFDLKKKCFAKKNLVNSINNIFYSFMKIFYQLSIGSMEILDFKIGEKHTRFFFKSADVAPNDSGKKRCTAKEKYSE